MKVAVTRVRAAAIGDHVPSPVRLPAPGDPTEIVDLFAASDPVLFRQTMAGTVPPIAVDPGETPTLAVTAQGTWERYLLASENRLRDLEAAWWAAVDAAGIVWRESDALRERVENGRRWLTSRGPADDPGETDDGQRLLMTLEQELAALDGRLAPLDQAGIVAQKEFVERLTMYEQDIDHAAGRGLDVDAFRPRTLGPSSIRPDGAADRGTA